MRRRVIIESRYAPQTPRPTTSECCCRDVSEPRPGDLLDLCAGHECQECIAWRDWLLELESNQAYARAAVRDCLMRGESPYASHLLYTQPGILDDTVPAERVAGIEAGFDWREASEATVVYTDLGTSTGMALGIDHAKSINHPIEYRTILVWPEGVRRFRR